MVFLEILTAILVGCVRQGRMDRAVLPRSFLFYLSQRPRLPTVKFLIVHLLQPLEALVETVFLGQGMHKSLVYYQYLLIMTAKRRFYISWTNHFSHVSTSIRFT